MSQPQARAVATAHDQPYVEAFNEIGAIDYFLRNAVGRILAATLLILIPAARGESVVNSRHNLSAGGPGPVKAAGETEVCIFCHSTHVQAPEAPLWNRPKSGGQNKIGFSLLK